ncbi:MAG: TnpV protein [Clostridia bacterium]|nr:TnpV protein [Clostridia bacterium]
MKITYREENGYLIPDVALPKQKEIGAWGLQHLGYLKRFRRARYTELLTSGELNKYLYKVNEEAQERFESLVADFAEKYGLTEELKAKDQMKWVALANYIAKSAQEIVQSELIFR